MASRSLTLYVGMTNGLRFRVWQHKRGEMDGFTKRYRINRLVYYEEYKYVNSAIARETELKKWNRTKKLTLIKSMNPTFIDLAEHWYKDLTEEMQIPRPEKTRARNDKSKKAHG
jgi:putative endonuclease